ncbi:MAG: pilus assembly protein [Ponticaulis sp.]|nr:pilus assembly protein [Ponticaulis sp.]|tara:strand:+ start:11286 stop:12236 length:951 start_codon:yes stop_codon:yes gene_type:complete
MQDLINAASSTPPLYYAIALIIMLAGGTVAFLQSRTSAARIQGRLDGDTGAGAKMKTAKPFLPGFLENLGKKTAGVLLTSEEAKSALRKRLIMAGYFSKSAPYWYTGARIFCLIMPQAVLLMVWPGFFGHLATNYLVYASLGLAIIGFIGPSFYLDKCISSRQDEYRDGFPDMMDLLVACVEAGLSLDAAVGRVAEELTNRYPNLADHLKILTLELRAGRSRQDAWSSLAERLGLEEARSLSTMLRQSEELGTSIGQTLKVFSDEMREKRMLTAEEKALALPAKLVVPLIVFVFPSLLGVLLLPAVIRMMWVMAAS